MSSSAAIDTGNQPETVTIQDNGDHKVKVFAMRALALSIVAVLFLFLINDFLNFGQQWPGVPTFFAHQGWFGLEPPSPPLSEVQITQGWLQLISYLGAAAATALFVLLTSGRTLRDDSALLSELAAYIIRAAFWGVFIIGVADIIISFLRVEE
ncbi:MAG: hypothetical protein KJN87_00120, partial [Desulfofustis sp.]|nr:hypothetical protein [Desulfofustis sp.]